jgi:hypothetical protein
MKPQKSTMPMLARIASRFSLRIALYANMQRAPACPVATLVKEVDSGADAGKAGYTHTFLSDTKAGVIRRYGVLDPSAGENGQDIARPAEFVLDSSGVFRWMNLTDDFRVRARPEEIICCRKDIF